MRFRVLIVAVLLTVAGQGQITVTNPTPHASLDSKKILYRDADNPVIISTGNAKSAKVSINNGTIKKTTTPGLYMVRPGNDSVYNIYTTITVTTGSKKYEFRYFLRPLPEPEVEASGPRTEGILVYFKLSGGIGAYFRDFDFEVPFKVDSFTLILIDSASSMQTHRNIGAHWDSVSQEMIDKGAPKTWVYIEDTYVSGPAKTYYFRQRKKVGYIR